MLIQQKIQSKEIKKGRDEMCNHFDTVLFAWGEEEGAVFALKLAFPDGEGGPLCGG